ncbi:uncharacterized protein PITG_09681 [Phytophthora infestans T30-4]|uniref:Transmembrane protein, putative n=1 Tax=Phytophthora infestans (strain T30-4) TaxID=403677 RepID=D0NCK1_PHYIT|nr:uncharacterized protein PITG_09681 [Phytophthora infestans T30-4]EEY55715.1 transmembrane protein, putative [Phytophthora infestans T30-4]|eukprot:XP_002903291.1 transmembrane protein, putative [Phytophthora infestans T30-4]
MTTRSANRTVLLDIEEDNGQATTATRSNRTRSHTSSTRSRAATTSSRSHSRRRPGEKKRVQSVATADFRGTNPVMDGDSEEEEQEPVERIPTLDERGHINFTNSRYKKSVDSAKRSVRARGALPAGSARSRDPFNPISPTRTNQPNDCRRQFQRQQAAPVDTRGRSRSRKQSVLGSWTFCGQSYPNWFIRLGTTVALVPVVVCGLIFWPVLAAASLTTILLCFCCYEHAWLSFRIYKQLLGTYQWYEGNEGPLDLGDVADDSTRSNASVVCGYQDGGDRRFKNSFVSTAFTQSTTSFQTGTMLGSDDGNMTFLSNDKDPGAETHTRRPKAIFELEIETSRGILLGMANLLFCGNLRLARVVVAVLLTICWSVACTMAFPLIPFPVSSTPRDIESAPYYFWVVNFVASLCAVSCPTWPSAVSLVLQKSAFEVLLLNALNCPLAASVGCSAAPISSMQAFALGAMAVVLVHSLSARGPASLVVAATLDLLGYAYVAGALGLLISMVDPSDRKSTWATIWLGMLSAMWVAQLAGYVCDAIMYRFQLPRMRLLPPRIVVTLDVEASLCAIAAGSLVLVFGGAVLDVPGGVVPKVLFSVGSVLMARFGRLIISLLKKAAGVRCSGRLMPGFGGALDGSHALLFTSIVFVKYYLYVIARQSSEVDDMSGSGSSALWATVTFSTDLRS